MFTATPMRALQEGKEIHAFSKGMGASYPNVTLALGQMNCIRILHLPTPYTLTCKIGTKEKSSDAATLKPLKVHRTIYPLKRYDFSSSFTLPLHQKSTASFQTLFPELKWNAHQYCFHLKKD